MVTTPTCALLVEHGDDRPVADIAHHCKIAQSIEVAARTAAHISVRKKATANAQSYAAVADTPLQVGVSEKLRDQLVRHTPLIGPDRCVVCQLKPNDCLPCCR